MHKSESARGIPKGLICPNCDKPINGGCAFEGIILCSICYVIADRLVDNCRRDLDKTLDVYKRILVAAIKEKRLHFPNANSEKETPMHRPV